MEPEAKRTNYKRVRCGDYERRMFVVGNTFKWTTLNQFALYKCFMALKRFC